ncbi:MAG: dihydrofolate reductase [Bacillota bacterium]|nr:dihydrofolate reductase [Eubacteriales bacterium]MDI9492474.1 dihydrofolate reductase [Bacillota bacterium]NLV69553.1 dihydrofolate reductase [Clostridiales bacterium]MDD3537453.1 dihydrofolate reductase [Eubacteriales bacterium]MDD4286514.1 dihydrofolate reductase [Eubacteriales bacterium]
MIAVAVIDRNRAIGRGGELLCRLPGDLAHFKKTTLGKTVIMGRKTLDSLPGGKPLPGRNTVVLSRKARLGRFYDDGNFSGFFLSSPEEVLAYIENELRGEEVYIAGGEQIYRLFLDRCDELILTELEHAFPDADAYFPEFRDRFAPIEEGPVQEEGGYRYRINRYRRV